MNRSSRLILFVTLILTSVLVLGGCLPPIRSIKDPSGDVNDVDPEAGAIYYEKTPEENLVFDTETGLVYSNNELLVVAQEGVSFDKIEQLAGEYGARITGYIELSGDYQWKLPGNYGRSEIERLIDEISSHDWVLHASLNMAIGAETEDLPSDALEWMTPTESDPYPEGDTWGIDAIFARDAWVHRSKMTPIRIGLIDNCFEADANVNNDLRGYSDTDLASRGHEDLNFSATFFNPPLSERTDSADFHGSHVAGIMAAGFQNGLGVDGIYPHGAGNLYGVSTKGLGGYAENNVMGEGFLSSVGYKCAFAELIARNVKVINMSLNSNRAVGFAADKGNQAAINHIQTNADVIGDFLNRLLDKGHDFVIVTAAGNNSNSQYVQIPNPDQYPYGWQKTLISGETQACSARYNFFVNSILQAPVRDRIVVVGSATIVYKGKDEFSYTRSTFSNAGDRLDLHAPGEAILSTMPDNDYQAKQGTSMAAPHVAGVAAMVWSINQNLSGQEVKDLVVRSADRTVAGSDRRLLNARGAVDLALQSLSTGEDPPVTPSEPKQGVLVSTVVDASDERTLLEGATIQALQKGQVKGNATTDKDGRFELTLPPGSYDLKVTADGFDPSEIKDLSVSSGEVHYLSWIQLNRKRADSSHSWEAILGTYKGSYSAPQGETGLTLTVFMEDDRCRARFSFYSLPGRNNAETGSYLMDVTFDETSGDYQLTGVEWIDKPTSYIFAHLTGRLEGASLVGTDPTPFKVTRVKALSDPYQELVGVYRGSYFANQGETALTLTVFMERDRCRAHFEFYNLPGRTNAESGDYFMDVTYDETMMEFTFTGVEWIVKPTTYVFIDLVGTFDGSVLTGTSPTRFHLTRESD